MSELLDAQKQKIVKLLAEKSVMKQDVFRNTLAAFEMIKLCVNEIAIDLIKEIEPVDKRVTIAVSESKKYSMQMKVAGDVLEFFMHTNVFEFDKSHPMFKSGYVKQHEYNSYCGIINVYNFLADSIKYNRMNDLGTLVCRIFVNREMRFFIEAKGPMGIKYSSFSTEPLNKENLCEIINDLVIYVITYDLFTPPYDSVRDVTVNEMQEKVSSINLRTGKRLGFGASASYEEDNNLYI